MTQNGVDKETLRKKGVDMSIRISEESIIHMVMDINFPISKGDLIQHIKERKGNVSNVNAVVSIINQIPNRLYSNSKDLEIEINRLNM